ncbi:carboxylating nicotinate-nucleotide diphosphorylase [Francisella philomiragia]|uniref:carboxylating nicotinate-nucleotide diphosphorylase n=1 Tax=Francisella philomiragia TaxID=28110 RepID=UPI0019048D78|nr:carboxylating nicotinate-nucleotide diphosphorylase [Francisella philomiragia]MBK2267397.1 carboxylating nicotinate-nucleotide diphosphorylase [Francisella philomiragia]MBK2278853.1 carboxylating nicotinate-nucleotide diphosphorylase [Francisella philomiragia]MBK2286907.1 carboxylating nicotinate-nucleotide diphosphorylase [Francisella philomiragia]MBK2288685.1 carboxylating nicotinate-nucleotide diphosphorylase [Francisella philomiragia]MBK2290403.1 carboxylating nicotinate-nucleotide diph
MSEIMLNTNQINSVPGSVIKKLVAESLVEDIADGDITAQLAEDVDTTAFCITREDMVLCGQEFANEVINQVDKNIQIIWFYDDADKISAGEKIFELRGNARSILTAERTMLNFIQMLSATATATNNLVKLIADYKTKLLDTRKTIPCFRMAQKYAVTCGGGFNHRIGLFDAYLIKENHIRSAGGIAKAVSKAARLQPTKTIEVEVTNLDELNQSIQAGANIIMLDNFSIEDINKAVEIAKDKVALEVSGNIDSNSIVKIAQTGVDFISVGAITKHITAIDLSMQVQL